MRERESRVSVLSAHLDDGDDDNENDDFWLVVWVLWQINLCRLFNPKSCLYAYTFNKRFLNKYLVGKIFYKQDFICLHMINQF